ncbi:GTP-binding protein [Clostridiales bacterium COT073_COT-073]|nr:GTP-binding protein [Clostridiales bacterium COT073_COT-073]
MAIRIALAGNPNSGKTTLFNGLTGSNQYVGNWPGVTVEKKEGKLKSNKQVEIVDLPGIYSLSPYTLEEVVAREYLIKERPEAILNIVDGSNLERNLYLTTQLLELGIPVVVAINMIDIVNKQGDKIDITKLSHKLGCPIVEISALKGTGITQAADKAVEIAQAQKAAEAVHRFDERVEVAIAAIEAAIGAKVNSESKRWYATKLFEKDEKVQAELALAADIKAGVENAIAECEKIMDDDAESIIASERYAVIADILKDSYRKQNKGSLTTSDKIDQVLTNRFLALPIFAIVMTLVYYISVTTVGTWATDWANEGVFGDGWHLVGGVAFEEATGEYEELIAQRDAYIEAAGDAGIDTEALQATLEEEEPSAEVIASFTEEAKNKDISAVAVIENEDGEVEKEIPVGAAEFAVSLEAIEPDPAEFGVWVPGVPVLVEGALDSMGVADWLKSLILDGIIAGVGAVLGFVPQLLILFIFLAFLEGCGYMARVAFIMDRVFRKFGLSGKSFIPMLISTGCGIPGVMASRTIESQRDRRMTIMTTTFMPCGAKLPVIALIAGALFGGEWWVSPSAYFIGIFAVVASGIILKKTKLFEGDPAPFVMELPAYHLPPVGNILRSMWERGSSFIKKAGTVILLSSIVIWILSRLGWVEGQFGYLEDTQLDSSILAAFGNAVAWMFIPLGFGDWKSAVATVVGLVAKENVVGTLGILYGYAEVSEEGNEIWEQFASNYTVVSGYAFLVFNLLCAPCFAAIGAIKREMNNAKWTWIAIAYQTVLAYVAALWIYQIGNLIVFGTFGIGTVVAIVTVIGFLYLLFRSHKTAENR